MITLAEEFELAKRLKQCAMALPGELRKSSIESVKMHIGGNVIADWDLAFKSFIGAFQWEKGEIGRRFEDLFSAIMDEACGVRVAVRQWKTPGWKHKPMDVMVALKDCDLFFSLAYSVRERKEHTWNGELEHLKLLYSKGATKREFRFFGVSAEPDKDLNNVRGKVKRGVDVFTVQNENKVRQLLTDVTESFVQAPDSATKKKRQSELPLWQSITTR